MGPALTHVVPGARATLPRPPLVHEVHLSSPFVSLCLSVPAFWGGTVSGVVRSPVGPMCLPGVEVLMRSLSNVL